MKDVSDLAGSVGPGNLRAALESQCVEVVDEKAARMTGLLLSRRYSAASPPPPEWAVYRLGEAVIATPGNVMAICAQPKAGKTAFLGGMLAATMTTGGDTFDVRSANAEGAAVLHFDTEQSPQHHHKAITRALHRAGQSAEPAWLYSYRVADLGLIDRRLALQHEIHARHGQHGAVHSVYLDGVADFISDPNNPEEAFGWVDELHQLAIKYQTVIVAVLHENPGSAEGKTRGHLGSQLERKAETNLRLAKDGEGVTVVFTERSRQAHVPRAMGPRFEWSEDAMMHVSCQSKAAVRVSSRLFEHQVTAREMFADVPERHGLKWKDVIDRLKDVAALTDEGARKRMCAMEKSGVIKHYRQAYYLS